MKKKQIDTRVRAWLLRLHPGEKPMIGDFSKTITWRELAQRMLAGEGFYDVTACTESVEREFCFAELARLFDTTYEFWYELWLGSLASKPREQPRGFAATQAAVEAQLAAQ